MSESKPFHWLINQKLYPVKNVHEGKKYYEWKKKFLSSNNVSEKVSFTKSCPRICI